MPSIGTHNFISLNGVVEQMHEAVEDITRPGYDGNALRKLGQRGPVFEMVSVVDEETAIAANTLYLGYKADQASIVNITDNRGETHNNYCILDVNIIGIRKVLLLTGAVVNVTSGSPAFLLTCVWSLQAAGDPTA